MTFLYGERKGDAILVVDGLRYWRDAVVRGVEGDIVVAYSVGDKCIVSIQEVDMGMI
jgi:hypothetical protein